MRELAPASMSTQRSNSSRIARCWGDGVSLAVSACGTTTPDTATTDAATTDTATGTTTPDTATTDAATGTTTPDTATTDAATGTTTPDTATTDAATGTTTPDTATIDAATTDAATGTTTPDTATADASSGTTTPDTATIDAAAGDAQPRQLTFNEDEDWNYGFSPDGSRIAFGSDRDGDDEVFVMNADGTGVVQLTDNDSDDWGGFWSPDGTRIAFSSDRDGDREVFVMNADGTGVVQLTDNDSDDWGGFWSPDGTRVAFSSDRDGDYEIFVVNADGSDTLQLTDNDYQEWNASWSPDGTRIVFDSDRDGDFEIFVMNADGTGVVQLTHNTAPDWAPQWSPDGSRIVFDSDPDYSGDMDSNLHGPLDVMMMNADGSGVRRLTQHPGYDSSGSWSPDGTQIAFTSDRDGDFEIFIIDVEAAIQSEAPADGSGAGENLDREPDASDQAEAGGGAETSAPRSTVDFLGHWPVEGSDSCGSWFRYLAPGDSVWISAEGFAPNSVVEFVAEGASLQPPEGKLLDAPQLPATESGCEALGRSAAKNSGGFRCHLGAAERPAGSAQSGPVRRARLFRG